MSPTPPLAPQGATRRRLFGLAAAFAAAPAAAQVSAPVATPGVTPAPTAPVATARVTLVTGKGEIVLDLFGRQAPITTANFLRYVDAGLYNGGTIYRAVRTPGAPDTGLVQGGARNDAAARAIPPIAHESTTQTGLSHTDGTVSLARRAPGTATSDFFLCVGDARYLDADPTASGDNLGFAAFGRISEGMDIARLILALPTSATAAVPEMAGQMLDPPVPIVSARRAA